MEALLCAAGFCDNLGQVCQAAQALQAIRRSNLLCYGNEWVSMVGDQHAHAGQAHLAAACYQRAVALYQGDLCVAPDTQALLERERLRTRHLTLLMRLADTSYGARRYRQSLVYAQRLLQSDPCREDAHRLAMRCYVMVGERARPSSYTGSARSYYGKSLTPCWNK